MKGGLPLRGQLQWKPLPFSQVFKAAGQRYSLSTSLEHQEADSNNPTSTASKDGARTLRFRQGNNRPLPLPPVMNPIVVSARRRYKEPKPAPDLKNLTPFQKQLYQNPYAHALATPVRTCTASETRLPSFFHLDLQTQPHPETKELWLVPSTLFSAATPSLQPTPAHAHPARVLARYSLLRFLGNRNRWQRALNQRLIDKLHGRHKRLVWREDMPDFVLELLRQTAMRKLRWPFLHKNARLVVACPGGAMEIEEHKDVACVLYLKSFETPELRRLRQEVEHLESEVDYYVEGIVHAYDARRKKLAKGPALGPPRLALATRYPPLHFPTAEYKGHKVLVYSLVDLLGEEKMKELLAGTNFNDQGCVLLKKSALTVSAQMWLLKLQGYVAESRA